MRLNEIGEQGLPVDLPISREGVHRGLFERLEFGEGRHHAAPCEVPELAAMVSMSVKQLERKFKKEYGTLPMKYINRIRLDAACQLLVKTRLPISKVATETGFYDSSHFANQFVKNMGLSPKEYREKHLDHTLPKLPEIDPSRLRGERK